MKAKTMRIIAGVVDVVTGAAAGWAVGAVTRKVTDYNNLPTTEKIGIALGASTIGGVVAYHVGNHFSEDLFKLADEMAAQEIEATITFEEA